MQFPRPYTIPVRIVSVAHLYRKLRCVSNTSIQPVFLTKKKKKKEEEAAGRTAQSFPKTTFLRQHINGIVSQFNSL